MRIGLTLFGLASASAGILDLIWGEFEPDHQPLQAWGDHIPGATFFAYVAALWLIAAGLAILWRRTLPYGTAALTLLYGVFVLFPLPRFYNAPHYLGQRPSVYIGVVSNVCEQVILFIAAFVAWRSLSGRGTLSPRASLIARSAFGFCSLAFGIGNLTAINTVTPLVPQWIPLGTTFWAVLTGIAFALAGLALLTGIADLLAARLLGAMLLVFSVLALAPLIFATPHNHVAWGGNAYNLTAVSAAWILAEALAERDQPAYQAHPAHREKPSPA